jgi:hypothetical protein
MEEKRNEHRILLAEAVETTWTRISPTAHDNIKMDLEQVGW